MVENQTFGQAIEALKKGKRVARKKWNGEMFVFAGHPNTVEVNANLNGQILATDSAEHFCSMYNRWSLCLKTDEDEVLVGWLPSQIDLFSEDWYILDYLKTGMY